MVTILCSYLSKAGMLHIAITFNIYTEKLMEETFNDIQEYNGRYNVKTVRYADNTAIVAIN